MKPKSFSSPSARRIVFGSAIVLCLTAGGIQAQTTILWNGAVNDVVAEAWGTATNWTGSNIPDADNEQADLRKDWGGATVGAPNLTLGADRTINGILSDDTGATGDLTVTINAGNQLILAGTNPIIQVDGSTLSLACPLGGANTWSKTGTSTLILSSDSSSTFTGGITVSAGTLDVRNISALGSTGVATTIESGARAIFGSLTTGVTVAENFVISGLGASNTGALNVGGGKTITLSGTINMGADSLIKIDGNAGFNFTSATGITGTDKNLSVTVDGGGTGTVTGPIALGIGGLTKASGGTLNLNGANTYTGPTNITGGTLGIAGTSGSILNTSGISATTGTLSLNNSAANVDRVADTLPVNLTLGSTLSLVHNTTTNTTETTGAINLGAGNSTLTVSSAASRVTTLAAASVNRGSNKATALVRGTSLSQAVATNVARITLGDVTGLPLVGTNLLDNGAVGDTTQAVKIIPFMLGDSSSSGTGNGFVTYDTTLGLRVLTAAQTTALTAGYTTAASPDNATVAASLTLDNAAGVTVNSLLFKTAAAALNSGAPNPLTINSGTIATTFNGAYSIDSGFSSLILGNDEGIIFVPNNTLTINTPVSITNGGGLTKAGGGTLALTAANTYAGPTRINQGTLSISNIANGGSPSALGSSTSAASNLVLSGGSLTYTGPAATSDRGATLITNGTLNVSTLGSTLALSGDITGTGILSKSGLGSLSLATGNSFTGNLTIAGTTGPAGTSTTAIGNIVRLENAEGIGPAATVKTITTTGSNRQFSMLELAGGITVDANKTLSMSGKSFFASADSSFGSPVSLRNASGNNIWLGNIIIGATGGGYSIESGSGTLTLGSVGTSSTLTQTAAADNRSFDLRGAGDIVIHSRLVNTGTSLINLQKMGSGTLTLSRTDNSFVSNPNFFVGTTIVESLANGGENSSIGAGATFNFGGTLRHVGSTNSVCSRAFGLVGPNPTIESSGTGTLTLNSPTTAIYILGGGTTVAPFNTGVTVLTALDAHTLFPGLTIAGNGIAVGTIITAVDYNTRQITLDTATVASTNGGLTSQGGVNFSASGTTNSGQNTLQFSVANASNTLLYVGQSVSGTGIAGGSVITGINTTTGVITLNNNLTANVTTTSGAISFNNNVVTISNTSNLDRTFTLGGTNTGDNLLGSPLVDPSATTGKLNLVKANAGKWILTGTSTYTGTTSVNQGALLVNGTHSGVSTYSVASGATLGGTGSIASAVNVAGTLAPGASIEDLATGALGFATGSTLAIEINTSSVTSDSLVVTGDVDLTGTVNLTLADLGGNVALPTGTKLTLVDYSGVWDDTDIVHFNGSPVPNGSTITLGANAFTVDYSDDSLGGTAMTLTAANGTSPFQTWASSPAFGLAAGDQDPTDDPDKDGRDNLLEFALDGNPADGSNNGKMMVKTDDSGDAGSDRDLTLTLAVRNGATLGSGPGGSATLAVDGIVYTIQGSANLQAWDKSVSEVTPAFTLTPAPGTGWTTRTFQVNDSNTLPDKRFIRVGVQ